MNIFEQESGFIGEAPTEQIRQSYEAFWKQVSSIRRQLGKRGYLLDNYMAALFTVVRDNSTLGSYEEGFGKVSEQRPAVKAIIEGTDTDNPLRETMAASVGAHPLGLQEHYTITAFHCCEKAGDILTYVTERFIHKQELEIGPLTDIPLLLETYRDIWGDLGGEEPMEKLNALFVQCFMPVTPMLAFLQGFTTDLIYNLMGRDRESGRLIFQIMLDEMDR